MAKKGGANNDINMAEEIRSLLAENRQMTGREVINALKEKFPKLSINENSCSVAYTAARKKLGIASVRRKRPTAKARKRPAGSTKSAAVSAPVAGMDMLQAAKELLQYCQGDSTLAAAALKHVAALQMK